ncbi:MAG TPA: SDR family oxidoreductase [Pirellulales bacterium]|nr:SDR family oxidoreductase [Pirellulales bacterium]
MNSLAGRVAIVTGGASGIGRATALALAREGAKVFTGDVREDETNAATFARLGIRERTCDVRREVDIRQLVDQAVGEQGRLDIVISNAGVGLVKQIPDVSEAEWDAVMDTNFKATFLLARYSIPHLRAAGGGAIVVTSSNAGILPRAHDPVYSTSKMALLGMVRSLALCHARDRIRVNAVCPGPVGDTGMMNADLAAATDREATARKFIAASPLAKAFGRMIAPEEVAQAILYLASDAAAMVTGTMIAIDGGKSLGVPPAE